MKTAYRNPRVALCIGAVLFSTGAWAMPPVGVTVTKRSETVQYHAAAARTPEGASLLYTKLQEAAGRVCALPAGSGRRFDDATALAACRSDALDRAVADLGLPMVSVLHHGVEAPRDAAVARR